MSKTKKILLSACLLASTIVLSRFLSIRTPIISIGFGFVPIILSAIILGPKYSVLIAGLADVIGALLFPSGAFFFGFTISSILTGLIHGIVIYRKDEFKVDKKFIIRLIISCFLVVFLINGVLNTIWVLMTSANAANIVVPIRIVKQLVMFPVQIITMLLITKSLELVINKNRSYD